MALEFKEFRNECPPLALGNPHREKEQDDIIPGLLVDDPPGIEEFHNNCCRDPPYIERSIGRNSRSDDGDLDGVKHAVPVFEAVEPVPRITGVQDPCGWFVP